MITGNANSSKNWVISSIQVMTGIRNKSIPGARMLRQVTIRLMAETNEAIPTINKPIA